MGGCRCSYKNCKSATKTTENLHFFHYPVKHTERCRKWIENACKPQFFDLAEDQLRNKVVCELHFEERCFTNISRRRLLHDAIPTLDAGAEEEAPPAEYQANSGQSDDINVVPASEDGTIFTVDSESLQQIPMSEKIESYIYNNGALVPIFKNEPNNVEESIVYTLENSNIEVERRVSKTKNGNVTTFDNLNKNNLAPRTYKLLINTLTESGNTENMLVDEEEASNGTADSSTEQDNQNLSADQIEIEEKPLLKRGKAVVNAKMLQRVKQHSKEIAYLKKSLRLTVTQNRVKNKKTVLTTLQPMLPPTLFAVVKRCAKKGELDVTEDELELYKDIYAASPTLYTNLIEKYGWKLPDASTLC